MSKIWKENSFKYLEKGLMKKIQEDEEKKLDADHNWQPKSNGNPPIMNEVAWPLIGEENER